MPTIFLTFNEAMEFVANETGEHLNVSQFKIMLRQYDVRAWVYWDEITFTRCELYHRNHLRRIIEAASWN